MSAGAVVKIAVLGGGNGISVVLEGLASKRFSETLSQPCSRPRRTRTSGSLKLSPSAIKRDRIHFVMRCTGGISPSRSHAILS